MNDLFAASPRTGSRPHRAAGSRINDRARGSLLSAALGLLVLGCGLGTAPSDDTGITIIPPDGTYTATTCVGVGHEFGKQLNDQVLAIIEANQDTPGNASDPISTAVIRLAQGANIHLRDIALQEACDVPEFTAAADQDLSPELRAIVGEFATTPVVTWDVWLEYVHGQLAIIDPEEASPS